MRIDIFLVENNITESRTEAKRFILDGAVSVNGKIVKKPSEEVAEDSVVSVDKSGKRFVSRGGLKLEAALDSFSVSVEGKSVLDIGASSGGFTDCVLQRGARRVIALDAGHGQLAAVLRADERVFVIEDYNARNLAVEDLPYVPDFAVMDVSFISATLIIPSVYNALALGGDFICLVKPQFEVGRSGLGKGGIVKSEKLREAAVEKVAVLAKSLGFSYEGCIRSPIEGGDGNVEFLVHFKKGNS